MKMNNKQDNNETPRISGSVFQDAHAGSEADGIRKRNKAQKARRSMGLRNRLLFFGILALTLLLISVFADKLAPYDPALQDLSNAKAPPSAAHLMGTDRYGRDLFSRVISGSRASIFSTLLLVAITTCVGTVVGIFCGWNGKRIDTILMRISDVFLAFPGLVFAMAVAGVLGG